MPASALVTTLEGAALLDVAKSVINHHAAGGLLGCTMRALL